MTSVDLTAELDRIRKRLERPWTDATFGTVCTEDAPRPLAAVEAVLELADETCLMSIDASGAACAWDLDPAELREVISRKLTGKEESDASS